MNIIKKTGTLLFLVLFCVSQAYSQTFVAGKNEFMLNGKPWLIRAAELHYPRIPKEYWEHRIQLCKAMGMNTICIYLFWNLHEQKPGEYDFSGQNDVVSFIKLIQKNGMYCIVRPGPYVCAEWDMGGLPWWLLKKKDLKVRDISDTLFMASSKRFMNKVGRLLAPLQYQNGGNIIMMQVENEYGVWGNDTKYMTAIRDNIRAAGINKVQLFRCDWSSNFDRYDVPEVASTLNFGAGADIEKEFRKFKELKPDAPKMCSEYWTGWFDQWGRAHETRGINTFIGSLKDMLDQRISFSLYMAHGGTSFGQWSGANAPPYAPTISSYDYDAPIDEAGMPTEKFYALRDLLKNYLNPGEVITPIPAQPSKLIQLPEIKFTQSAAVFSNLPVAKQSKKIQPMEMFNQGWGQILYRTRVSAYPGTRRLQVKEVHDYAVVYLNGKLIGTLDRRLGQSALDIPALKQAGTLDILIETTGRVNYGQAIYDRKGITEQVLLTDARATRELENWQVYNIPVNYANSRSLQYRAATKGPAWHKASFNVTSIGDTYLNVSHFGKGMVWVNGRALGRYWNIGPTQTMFLPGTWLKKQGNEIIVLDVTDAADTLAVNGITQHLYKVNGLEQLLNRKSWQNLDLSGVKPVASGTLTASNGWKEITFSSPVKGRYFCLEALSAQTAGDNASSVAELEIIGEDGKAVSPLPWLVVYADSEEVGNSNNTADKIFDLQESVIWQTSTNDGAAPHPHAVVVDMGKVITIKGFRVLPRNDKKYRGILKDYRFYVQEQPFKM